MSVGLIKHNLEKFGALTVMDVTLFDLVSHKPVLNLDTLQISNISGEGQSKEVKGGIGDNLLIKYNYGRQVDMEITDALTSLHALEKLWGGNLKTTGPIDGHIKFVATTDGTGKILATDAKLVAALKGGVLKSAYGYKADGAEIVGTVNAGAVTFTGANETELTIYAVASYTAADGKYSPAELAILSNKFPDNFRLVGKTVFHDVASGKQVFAEIEIPHFAFTPSISMNLASAGDAATFDFSGSAIADSENQLIIIRTLAYEN